MCEDYLVFEPWYDTDTDGRVDLHDDPHDIWDVEDDRHELEYY